MDFSRLGSAGGVFFITSISLALLAWFFEDALSSEIAKNKWVLPVLIGLSGGGLFTFLYFKHF